MSPLPNFDFSGVFSDTGLAVLAQVLTIDLVLAGDNVVVIGALVAGLSARDRRRVIGLGIGAALVLRVAFALIATALIQLPGLLLAAGLLLFWVSWSFWRELRSGHSADAEMKTADSSMPRRVLGAAGAVALADVSMSLDNVLGVVGAARQQPAVLMIGLVASVLVMGFAADLVARVIERWRWIAYGGLAVLVFVAGRMSWDGWNEIAPRFGLS